MRIRFIHKIFYLGLLVFIFSCNQQSESYSEEEIKEHSAEVNEYFEEEFQKDVEESPMMQTRLGQKTNYGKWDNFSHLKYAEDRNKAKRRLGDLKKIDPSSLDEETRLSYDLYLQKQENILEDYDFRFYNYPVNQMFGYHAELPAFLINMHRIDSISDAEAYISRLKGIPKVMEDVIGNLKIREQNGIMPPIFVFDRVLESSRNVIKGKPFGKSVENSALLEDFKSKIDDLEISQKKKKELISKAETALTEEVKPAYQNLIVFLETQQKRANSDAGAWKFPKGEEFYANALKRATTTNLSANQIHEIGLSEVARIHAEMEKIKKKVGFKGTLQDFFEFMRKDKQFYYANDSTGRSKYLTEARSIINTMKDDLDKLFLTKPEAELVVKAVEPFREKNAGKAFYQQPAKDGSRPGTYYANLYDMSAMPTYQMEALAYHEGIPGHHMQIAIAQELEGIPQFRKFSFYTAYVEGWGLYSELLPKEIGYYKDPYSDFGRLAMELWRSCRLVVDTGIHAKKWTREEGIAYYKENTPNAESDCIKMVERHIVMPGQATAYKIGMNKILELRENAKEELGGDFDIREFHDVILLDGAVPLNILEEKVDNWVSEENI
ncbi:DUF885 domain-containing protein [Salegentibacter mishustinae]|uniref:Lipoprotein n=1 Tax=Salegentibacter mishustinae TaxID=270918 RepID=A0A0Q9ZI53_9FLAO|nr:DUF885 domain-containing protein [Salegentibacter mishustinae]KRG29054.1 hypothetical protein APR42_03760 [Salegentibacter mishustinae]PNW21894.1 hypothetical protein APB85_11730 [Salegentibacter mishustinae]PZX65242.1 uncharacterized protein (DUF885 family) [Salegentibacter mishustinae]GGW86393.1 hypothetical protein GCM10008086_13400 [Salegentibacter mishustinae]